MASAASSTSSGTGLAEGSNIHFSPIDKKPLCSYSSKLCRQRRLNGYGFCIRHILEDKSAPFKQCHFVTRNNSQKCLNAIPRNQERGYCHSHMQVAGIIPKTSKKPKQMKQNNNQRNATQSESESSDSKLTLPDESNTHKSTNDQSHTKPKSKKVQIHRSDQSTPNKVGDSSMSAAPVLSFLNRKKGKVKLKASDSNSETAPQVSASFKDLASSRPFEQLKTLKILEKLSRGSSGFDEEGLYCFPTFSIPSNTLDDVPESRSDFLRRVRESYKTQYESLRVQLKERRLAEERSSVYLRKSLLACARVDPKRCAQILQNGEDCEESENGLSGTLKGGTSGKGINSSDKGTKPIQKVHGEEVGSSVMRGKIRKGVNPKIQRKVGSSSSTTPTHPQIVTLECGKSGPDVASTVEVETVIHSSVASSDVQTTTTSDGIVTDTSFDSAFDHSPHHAESDFGDVEELERTFALHIDPEIAHQASRIMEENGLTEEDFTDLFPESRLGDAKGGIGNDIVGLDLQTSSLDATDIDYAIFSNIFHRPQTENAPLTRNNF